MLDRFKRKIDYLRLSVTDRCDLRCKYCMPLRPDFYTKSDFLTLDDLKKISGSLFDVGIKKIRITGGEPLIRKDIIKYIEFLSENKQKGKLNEILLTTNGTQLKKFAKNLSELGVRRINISIDSLIDEKYSFITNGGNLKNVMDGIYEAKKNNLEIKINTVLLKKFNEDEILKILNWCATENFKLSFIEVMPIGELATSRINQYLPVSFAKKIIKKKFGLIDSTFKSNGPSRYFKTKIFNSTVGFISPISNNFCSTCNRIRVTSSGILYGCLGDNSSVDLKPYLIKEDLHNLTKVFRKTIYNKPERHHFDINNKSTIKRFMNTTGG